MAEEKPFFRSCEGQIRFPALPSTFQVHGSSPLGNLYGSNHRRCRFSWPVLSPVQLDNRHQRREPNLSKNRDFSLHDLPPPRRSRVQWLFESRVKKFFSLYPCLTVVLDHCVCVCVCVDHAIQYRGRKIGGGSTEEERRSRRVVNSRERGEREKERERKKRERNRNNHAKK